jgi:uncharacterized membrane protein YeaQ/YmgE (transglycosylase-associated protein family)
MKPDLAHVLIYSAGWILFVAAQAYNSVRSSANGLYGWEGYLRWLKLQAVNLATRVFFCAILFGWVMQLVTSKIQTAGLGLESNAIAGIAGYAANALLYQAFGLLPFLRVEVQDLAPPPNAQVVPVPAPPSAPPPSETRS